MSPARVFGLVFALLALRSARAQSDTEIFFLVDMNVQTAIGAFDPAADTVVVRGALNGWGCSQAMADTDGDGIFELELQVPAHALGAGGFKYNLGCSDRWETGGDRFYQVTGTEPDADADGFKEVILEPVFYDNVSEAGPDVELLFQVDMNVQVSLGAFDPAVDTVVARGSLNAWACSVPMVDPDGDGVFELEIQVPAHPIRNGEYKYNISCGNRWEQGGNRVYQVTGQEPDADGDGFLEVIVGPRFFDDNSGGADVEVLFRVDMSAQIAMGLFAPDLETVVVRGGLNNWGCSAAMAAGDLGIYSLEVQVPGHLLGTGEFKYNISCNDGRWELRGNRGYQVTGTEPDADGDGFLEILSDVNVPLFDDQGLPAEIFIRGDGDADGMLNITDGIFVLNYLFSGGVAAPSCEDAADANDDGTLNITDPIYVLSFLFTGGPPPLEPGPAACGPDPSPDDLGPCTYSC
jgi:hypothetical protein